MSSISTFMAAVNFFRANPNAADALDDAGQTTTQNMNNNNTGTIAKGKFQDGEFSFGDLNAVIFGDNTYYNAQIKQASDILMKNPDLVKKYFADDTGYFSIQKLENTPIDSTDQSTTGAVDLSQDPKNTDRSFASTLFRLFGTLDTNGDDKVTNNDLNALAQSNPDLKYILNSSQGKAFIAELESKNPPNNDYFTQEQLQAILNTSPNAPNDVGTGNPGNPNLDIFNQLGISQQDINELHNSDSLFQDKGGILEYVRSVAGGNNGFVSQADIQKAANQPGLTPDQKNTLQALAKAAPAIDGEGGDGVIGDNDLKTFLDAHPGNGAPPTPPANDSNSNPNPRDVIKGALTGVDTTALVKQIHGTLYGNNADDIASETITVGDLKKFISQYPNDPFTSKAQAIVTYYQSLGQGDDKSFNPGELSSLQN
jgi:hypothetical protein